MKSRFSRPICWSVFIFCLAYNARADTPAPASKNKYERVAPPSQPEIDSNKPVLIDTERIKGHHEYETGANGETELRSDHAISADQKKSRQKTDDPGAASKASIERPVHAPEAAEAPEDLRSGPQQNYARSPAKDEPALAASPVEPENRENQPKPTGVERITGHAAQEDEASLRRERTAPTGVATSPAKATSRMAAPGAGAE